MKGNEPTRDDLPDLGRLQDNVTSTDEGLIYRLTRDAGWWGFLKAIFNPDAERTTDRPTAKPTIPILLPASEWAPKVVFDAHPNSGPDPTTAYGFMPAFYEGFTYLDLLLYTAMGRGFTVRPFLITSETVVGDSGKPALRFIPAPFPGRTGRPPTLSTVKKALIYKETWIIPMGSMHKAQHYGGLSLHAENLSVSDVLNNVYRTYGIAVMGHQLLRPLPVMLELALGTFSEVMDQLAMQLDAHWDWYGEAVTLLPAAGNPVINYACSPPVDAVEVYGGSARNE